MSDDIKQSTSGTMTLSEIREFASFSPKAQRYIRLSLDIAFDKEDALALWPRDDAEMAAMKMQKIKYRQVDAIKDNIPHDSNAHDEAEFFGQLLILSTFDIIQGKLDCFAAYRFLYERLLGANVRPWLPAIFCASASMPQLEPDDRKKLLQSISEAAATAVGWSRRTPSFFPEWVETVDAEY